MGDMVNRFCFVPMDHKTYTEYLDHRSEEHTSELQSRQYLVCRLLLEKKLFVPVVEMQAYSESGAFAGSALHFDLSIHLLHQQSCEGETYAGSHVVGRAFVMVEQFEDTGQVFGIYPYTRIAHA